METQTTDTNITSQVNPGATDTTTQTQETTVTEENKATGDATITENIDNSNSNETTETNGTVSQPTIEQENETLKAKLKEYELDDSELNQLKQRLGIDNVDYGAAQIANTIDMVESRSQQEYVKLCTKYGVDSRPEQLEASARQLQERDPKAFYEFQIGLDRLANARTQQLAQIQEYSMNREVNKFYTDNQPILDASPAIQGIIRDYVSQTPKEYVTRDGMNYYLEKAREIYTEAYYAGLQAGQKDKALDPNKLLNGSVAGSQQTSYPMGSTTWTKDQIANMTLEEFAKNEKEIMKQMMDGRIK